MLASRAVRWKFEFSVVRRRRPDAAGRHRAALVCGFEGWLEPVTAEAKVDCLPFRRNEGTTTVRKKRPFPDNGRTGPTLSRTGAFPPHRNEVSERGESSCEFDDKALSAE
jgi:hypothetical protein